MEVTHHVHLHPVKPGPGGGDALGGNAKGDIFGAFNAVVAPGNLAFQHPHELAPDAVKIVRLGGDVHMVAAGGVGAAVDKGELDGECAVEVAEERAPLAENRRLHGIIDVLIFHGFRVEPTGELTHAVRVRRYIGDRLELRHKLSQTDIPLHLLVVYAVALLPRFPWSVSPRPRRPRPPAASPGG